MDEALRKLRESIASVYMGNALVVDRLVACLLARGTCLIEDVPGVGKTVLRQRARSFRFDADFSRIQCTPDLLPTDITGAAIFNRQS